MSRWLIGIIFVLGLLLRTVSLTAHPTGFTPDEASFGYDAYSILQTGADQWGNRFPLNLKSFGDYKLPVYSYLTMPSIALFGLNVFATRLPNAIIGSLAILFTFLLAKKLFNKDSIALFSALLLTLSPWHIALSRGAFEANLTTFFLTAGIYFLLQAEKNKKYFIVSAVLLGINLFTYHTARLMTLPVACIFIIQYYSTVTKIINLRSFAIIVSAFIVLTIYAMFHGGGGRLATSSIFSTADDVYTTRFSQLLSGEPNLLNKLFNNKLTHVSKNFIQNYVSYLSPQFLITEGAREYTYGMRTNQGVLLYFELATVLVGTFWVFFKRNKALIAIFGWIIISVIPAALSVGPGHAANRAAFMMPAIQILSAYGLYKIILFFNRRIPNSITYILVTLVVLASSSIAFESYWYGQAALGARSMFYGAQDIVEYVRQEGAQFDKVVVTKGLSEPHIFFAFYEKIDPEYMQSQSVHWEFEKEFKWVDQLPSYTLGKITFINIDWERERLIDNALIIGRPKDFPEYVRPVHTVYYPNGDIAYLMVDTRTRAFVYNN